MAVIDEMVAKREKSDRYTINNGNLLAVISNKIFREANITHLTGSFGAGDFVGIQSAVRSKMLDLTLAMEAKLPAAADIEIGGGPAQLGVAELAKLSQMTQNIFYGPVQQIANSGHGSSINMSVMVGNVQELKKAIRDAEVDDADAAELAQIISEEKPESPDHPIGERAKQWIAKWYKDGKKIAGAMTVDIATDVLAELAKGFWGL
jgi:hypothetical protein